MRLFLFAPVLMLAASAHAQYGYAKSGVYPSDYHMQTFTGKLVDYDPATHQITLQCDICADDERFVAIVGDTEISKTAKMMVSPQDRSKLALTPYTRKPAPEEIVEGDLLRAYYNERKTRQPGKPVKYNAVFAMEKLASAPQAAKPNGQ